MYSQFFLSGIDGYLHSTPQRIGGNRRWERANSAGVLSAAQARLTAAADVCRRRRELSNEDYYGSYGQLEETIGGISSSRQFDAVVTRNHYGCLVLNTAHALFIDVDLSAPSPMIRSAEKRRECWQGIASRTFNDLRTVLANEKEEGFRIYRTAAGFRVLATAHEFEPGSERATRLMEAVGADVDFVDLCAIQKTFRARLTPKPWRCGMKRPPSAFPRMSADDQRCFNEWLSQYDRLSRERATCQYLEHVGPECVHPRVASIIEVHDRETKALDTLPLA